VQRGERNQPLERRKHLVVDDHRHRKAGPAVHDAVADGDGLVAGVMRPQPSGDPNHCRRHVRDLAGAEVWSTSCAPRPLTARRRGALPIPSIWPFETTARSAPSLTAYMENLMLDDPAFTTRMASTLGSLSPEPALRAFGNPAVRVRRYARQPPRARPNLPPATADWQGTSHGRRRRPKASIPSVPVTSTAGRCVISHAVRCDSAQRRSQPHTALLVCAGRGIAGARGAPTGALRRVITPFVVRAARHRAPRPAAEGRRHAPGSPDPRQRPQLARARVRRRRLA
jgi:hypothetical protein